MSERIVLGHRGTLSMTRIRWTDKIPGNINDVEDAVEMPTMWEGAISSPMTWTASWSSTRSTSPTTT